MKPAHGLFAHTQQKVIAQDIFGELQYQRYSSSEGSFERAAWQGFIAGLGLVNVIMKGNT